MATSGARGGQQSRDVDHAGPIPGNRSRDELAGHLGIGLALLGADEAKDELRALVERSPGRPERFRQAVTALAMLGHDGLTDQLLLQLDDDRHTDLVRLAGLSTGLRRISDRASIDPLIGMLHDDSLSPLSRAFVDAGGNDFRLLAGSPAIDSGHSLGSPGRVPSMAGRSIGDGK